MWVMVMIEEDIEIIKRRILWEKIAFVLDFLLFCTIFLSPVLILLIFTFSSEGKIVLGCSLGIFVIALVIVAYMGERIVCSATGAVAIDPWDQKRLASMAEDIYLATGKPFPELMLIDDREMCNMFSIKRGRKAVIFVTSGILDRLDDDELRAALAHEMAHIYQGDAAINTLGISFKALSRLFLVPNSSGRSACRITVVTDLLLLIYGAVFLLSLYFIEYFPYFLLFLLPVLMLFGFGFFFPLFLPLIVRNRDLMSDELAAKLTLEPEALIGALQKAQACDRGGQLAYLQSMTFVPAAERVNRKVRRLPGVKERIDNLERAFQIGEDTT